ncbi:uncharacterized protein MKK02DRAFT_29871 [Dioszegia hungarica]|uniref:Uncharacterized protein n=1 Tax=Dioszegia hungarica TaxID=4972 RepID=A0AA38HF25_9TREE|nr:uncharacterized protein MKK02DRAFT_29871 [Dioszegia hungarica]KAI9639902.1 hypothetical protein MKK02DRAFT_29871 [Dioszegia hungarica]
MTRNRNYRSGSEDGSVHSDTTGSATYLVDGDGVIYTPDASTTASDSTYGPPILTPSGSTASLPFESEEEATNPREGTGMHFHGMIVNVSGSTTVRMGNTYVNEELVDGPYGPFSGRWGRNTASRDTDADTRASESGYNTEAPNTWPLSRSDSSAEARTNDIRARANRIQALADERARRHRANMSASTESGATHTHHAGSGRRSSHRTQSTHGGRYQQESTSSGTESRYHPTANVRVGNMGLGDHKYPGRSRFTGPGMNIIGDHEENVWAH